MFGSLTIGAGVTCPGREHQAPAGRRNPAQGRPRCRSAPDNAIRRPPDVPAMASLVISSPISSFRPCSVRLTERNRLGIGSKEHPRRGLIYGATGRCGGAAGDRRGGSSRSGGLAHLRPWREPHQRRTFTSARDDPNPDRALPSLGSEPALIIPRGGLFRFYVSTSGLGVHHRGFFRAELSHG
jgi:hypothetical protein